MLLSELEDILKKDMKGTLSFNERSMGISRINDGALSLLDQICTPLSHPNEQIQFSINLIGETSEDDDDVLAKLMEARLLYSMNEAHKLGIRVDFDLEILIKHEIKKLHKESISTSERIKLAFLKNVLSEFEIVKTHYKTAISILVNTNLYWRLRFESREKVVIFRNLLTVLSGRYFSVLLKWVGKDLNEEFELWEEYRQKIIRHDTQTDFVGFGNIPNELTRIDLFTKEYDLVFSIHLNETEISHLCNLAKSSGLWWDSLTNEQFLQTFLCGPWNDYDTVYLSDETKVKKALPHLIWELSINYPDISPIEMEERFSISNFRIGLG